jgi:hypothetical protein
MTAEEIEKRIDRAVATDLISGEKQELVRKGRCHFFDRFRSGPYDVQLRIDWKDIVCGFPRLDADFYYPGTDTMDTSMKGQLAHHTSAEPTQNMQLYMWEYQDQKRHLRIDLSWWATGTGYNVSYGSGSARAVNPPDRYISAPVEQAHPAD